MVLDGIDFCSLPSFLPENQSKNGGKDQECRGGQKLQFMDKKMLSFLHSIVPSSSHAN